MMRSEKTALRRLLIGWFVASLVLASGSFAFSKEMGSPVNLNTATSGQLQTLPGIGPAKAGAIISYRSKNGPFKRVDDLVQVKGIGPKTLSKLRPLVTIGAKRLSDQSPRRAR
ncbi:MAG: ComEA family DNA-binding protein [Myxococcota bacterium]